jgi:CubicO group peptidase (beta-lactamase class C family)
MKLVALALLVACGGSSTTPVTPAVDHAANIERGLHPAVSIKGEPHTIALEQRMRELHINAVSIAVFQSYKVVWARAYGLADTGVPATPETLFQAGSISKSVNALGTLEAVADGVLSLDTPINDSLTGWKLPDNDLTKVTPVTLRELLSHTAGTTVHGFPGYAAGLPVPTIKQILDGEPPANSPAIRVDLAPNTQFRYSGGGITIAQLALTERSKASYPELLARRVLQPLGMTHSTYEQPLPAALVPHAAAGYGQDGTQVVGKRHIYPEMAAAGLWTTPADLARFFSEIALARANRSKLVSNEIALEMTTAVKKLDPNVCCVARPEAVLVADRLAVPGEPWSGAEAGRRVGLARVRRRRCQRRSSRVTLCRSRPRARGSAASAAEPRIRTARRRGPGPAERDGLQGHGSTG